MGNVKNRRRSRMRQISRVRWSTYEIVILIQDFPTKSTEEIARKLGRSEDAVRSKATRLGLSEGLSLKDIIARIPSKKNKILVMKTLDKIGGSKLYEKKTDDPGPKFKP